MGPASVTWRFCWKVKWGTRQSHDFFAESSFGPSVSQMTFLLKGHLGPSVSHVTFLLKGQMGPASVMWLFCWKFIQQKNYFSLFLHTKRQPKKIAIRINHIFAFFNSTTPRPAPPPNIGPLVDLMTNSGLMRLATIDDKARKSTYFGVKNYFLGNVN